MKYPECNCEECQSMCTYVPCQPTIDEAQRLIDAGFGDRLMQVRTYGYNTLMPASVGYEGVSDAWKRGTCTFYKNGLCELHNLGLKPIEGRVAIHGAKANRYNWVWALLSRIWRSKKGVELVETWKATR